jgi:hypothetical protein
LGFATGGLAGVGALYPATAGVAGVTVALGFVAVVGCATGVLLNGTATAGTFDILNLLVLYIYCGQQKRLRRAFLF